MTGEEGYTIAGRDQYMNQKPFRRPYLGLAAFFIGMAAGAGLALLLAPTSGQEARRRLKEASGDAKEKAAEYYEDMRSRMGSAVEKGMDLFEQGRPLIATALQAGREAYEKEKEKARQVAEMD